MEEQFKNNTEQHETAGQNFVSKIGPAGCILFLCLLVLTTAILLTAGKDPIPGYEAPHDTTYYETHLEELCEELNSNVLPHLSDPALATVEGDHVTVTVEAESFVLDRSGILHFFDESLLEFEVSAS